MKLIPIGKALQTLSYGTAIELRARLEQTHLDVDVAQWAAMVDASPCWRTLSPWPCRLAFECIRGLSSEGADDQSVRALADQLLTPSRFVQEILASPNAIACMSAAEELMTAKLVPAMSREALAQQFIRLGIGTVDTLSQALRYVAAFPAQSPNGPDLIGRLSMDYEQLFADTVGLPSYAARLLARAGVVLDVQNFLRLSPEDRAELRADPAFEESELSPREIPPLDFGPMERQWEQELRGAKPTAQVGPPLAEAETADYEVSEIDFAALARLDAAMAMVIGGEA